MKKLRIILLLAVTIGLVQSGLYAEPIPTSNYVELSGGKLVYNEFNEGDSVVIMIHGSPGTKESFDLLAPAIVGRKIYALDMFCFGESSKLVDDCGIDGGAESIREFMDELNIPTATIVGFSWGSGVAITFADKYPDKIDKLILLSGSGLQEGEPPGSYLAEQAVSLTAYLPNVYYPGSFFGDYRERRGFLRSFLHSDFRPIEGRLANIETKTLLIHGERDQVIRPWVAKRHNELLQNSELMFIDGGHGSTVREVDVVVSAINEFLKNE